MTRQASTPVLISAAGGKLIGLQALDRQAGNISEAAIQGYIHAHPACIPFAEIDPLFSGVVSICRELPTLAGPIDNLLMTPTGLPVLVECKLWRNPEARREVVGQILDYAKELSRWSSSDLQRAVKQRLKGDGNPLLDLVRASDPTVDEIAFNDALTKNLRRGRFLLLIVGDGIREGVEAIAEYLQEHAGLHFSLGLVELPIYAMPDGSRLLVPRVLARTTIVTRTVIVMPEGHILDDPQDEALAGLDADPDRAALSDEQQQFWGEFLFGITLDDPEQQVPKPARQGYLNFKLPAPSGSAWLTVYRDLRRNEVGVFLSCNRSTAGEHAMYAIAEEWETVRKELGESATKETDKYGRPRIIDHRVFGPLQQAEVRRDAFKWLAGRLNTFVNVLRPRVRSAVADYKLR